MSLKEISEVLNIPVGTVKSRINKGLSVLRKFHDKGREVKVIEKHREAFSASER
jgi:DNA-directed RNA polymerase specialized sigma24 family protein